MWDGLFTLLALSLVMLIASILAGSLPLSLSLSSRQLRLITSLGTGVLVGTSLIVIIPEGIETLYSTTGNGHSHARRAHGLERRDALQPGYAQWQPSNWAAPEVTSNEQVALPANGPMAGRDIIQSHDFIIIKREDAGTEAEQASEGHHDDDNNKGRDPHAYVGISLILGFILMYLIDKLPKHTASLPSSQQPLHISLRSLSRGAHRPNSPTATLDDEDPLHEAHMSQPEGLHQSFSTTIGLVIHAVADGIALGASSTSENSRLGFVIFIALMIHKAPAAFGLTSVLLKQGLSKKTARAHLIIFSCAAPAGAIVTWITVHMIGRYWVATESDSDFATGLILLFSAGTFLYVAMHTMQESGNESHGHSTNGYADANMYERYGNVARAKEGPALSDTAVAVIGMLVPLLTQVGHAH